MSKETYYRPYRCLAVPSFYTQENSPFFFLIFSYDEFSGLFFISFFDAFWGTLQGEFSGVGFRFMVRVQGLVFGLCG